MFSRRNLYWLAFSVLWLGVATAILSNAVPASFSRALANVLVHEGGYSNDAHDPGGVTLNGIIQTEYDHYRESKALPLRPLTRAMLGNPEWIGERDEIYLVDYWRALGVGGDLLMAGLDYAVFDYGVNSGTGRSGLVLRRVLGLPPGKIIDASVVAKVRAGDIHTIIDRYVDEREAFLMSLRTCQYFCTGWLKRTASVRHIAHAMAGRSSIFGGAPMSPAFGPGKAFEDALEDGVR